MTSLLRKKRSSSGSHHQIPASTTASATTAAAQAFLAKNANEHQLSNAAAAAALRSYTPTPVGDIQTKRMIRRGSTSSLGSNASNQRQPFSSDHQRRGSSGSMTQRSFRSPSPGRNATPPVPALPAHVPPLPNNGTPTVPAKSSKRIESSPRNAVSPTPVMEQNKSMQSSRWASPKVQAPQHSPTTTRAQDTASPTSPRKINFSRPMSPQAASPQPFLRNSTQSPQPAASLGLTPEQYRRLEERREAARLQDREWIEREQKRNEAQRLAREGAQAKAARPQSSLGPSAILDSTTSQAMARQRQNATSPAKGTRPLFMPVAPITGYRHSSAPTQRPQVDTQVARLTQGRQGAPFSTSTASTIPEPTSDQIKAFQTRAASLLARPLTDNSTSSSKLLPKAATTNNLLPSEVNKQHNRSVSSPVSAAQQPQDIGRGRAPSESPARSARFSAAPLLPVTKHIPPPRSISPVKSAMKGSSPRNISPAQHRDATALSDAGSALSDESSVPNSGKRKKGVRVSFEERPIMVGQAAEGNNSPINTILSPQNERSRVADDQNFEMGPRPLLPSFGSVRGKKELIGDDSISSDRPRDETLRPVRSIKDNAAFLRDDTSDDEINEPMTLSDDGSQPSSAAPQIAVQPATPNVDENTIVALDAGEPRAHDLEGALTTEDASSALKSHPKPVIEDDQGIVSLPQSSSSAAMNSKEESSDTDEEDNERFSDSVQDQSELEGTGGYTSLDAILESPATEARESDKGLGAFQMTSQDAVPMSSRLEREDMSSTKALVAGETIPAAVPTANAQTEDWNQARAYWSSLSEQQKQALENGNDQTAIPSQQKQPPTSETTTAKTRLQPNGSVRHSGPPPKSALKQSKPKAGVTDTEPTHFRMSMRNTGSMMSSMRGAPERSPSRGSSQKKSKPTSEPQASPDAIALAQATAKAMAAKEAERKASKAAAETDRNRGRAAKRDEKFHYTMGRSMREGRATPSARPISPDEFPSMRKPMRGSVRHSMDSTSDARGSGFLGFGKSKSKQSKPKKTPSSGGGRRFASRFADSSDEDSDGGTGSRFGFRSRFADSDDSDDEISAKPMKIDLAPVRGIPKRKGQEEGESTELDDSDDDALKKNEPALPRSSKDRPGTPPTSAVLSFGKNPNLISIESSKHAPEAIKEEKEDPSTDLNVKQANGDVAEGKALAAGTLRDDGAGKERDKRQSILSFGRKSKATEHQPALTESKWANSPSSPNSRPQTPSRGMAKTLRESKSEKDKRSSMLGFRRLSIGSRDSSVPGTPTGGRVGKEDFPFPPPPIPEQYVSSKSPSEQPRPSTSDGLGASKANPSKQEPAGPSRPPLGEPRQSTMTDPGVESNYGSQRRSKLAKEPTRSKKTGKPKKFQGLRRAFGLND